MDSTIDFMPILFKVLFVFIIVNIVINIILLYTRKLPIYKLLVIFWPACLIVFITQAAFQTGNLAVTYAYSTSYLSLTIFSMIGFEIRGHKFPLVKYLILFGAMYPITYFLDSAGFGFTIIAMPFALSTALPLLHASWILLVKDRKSSTRLQKVLGIIYFLFAPHCINFALFRMDPGSQLWGWLVSYLFYDILAVFLPAIALEESHISQNERLCELVEEKTSELNKSLIENQSLLKVILHDLSGPLMTLKFYLARVVPSKESQFFAEKALKSHLAIEMIFQEIKTIYGKQKRNESVELGPVDVGECFSDVQFLCAEKLQLKNINLRFENLLPPGSKVLADRVTLTHSVLGNLINNALKFSYPDATIDVIVREEAGEVIFEVKDRGTGMPEEVIRKLQMNQEIQSSRGTNGEVGQGLGLSIAKSFIDSYGGKIEFESRNIQENTVNHGTDIRFRLIRA